MTTGQRITLFCYLAALVVLAIILVAQLVSGRRNNEIIIGSIIMIAVDLWAILLFFRRGMDR